MEVRALIVASERVSDRVMTVGTVLANEEVEIRSEVSGKIDRIFFNEGQRVTKGDVLVKVNDAELRAQLLRAQSRLALAEQQEARQRQLYEKTLVSKEDYDNAVTSLSIARADVQLIEAQMEKTQIKAPFEGVVGLRFVSEGSYISPTTLITTLQDYARVKVDFSIPEKYSSAVRVGDRVTFTTENLQRPLTATIYARDPKIDPRTRTLRLRATRSNTEGTLLPGSFATVEVLFKEKNAVMIPSYALVPELKGQRVFVYRNGKAEAQSVQIGLRTDQQVEVTEGVQPGDTLILSGILQLRSGMPVRLTLMKGNEQ